VIIDNEVETEGEQEIDKKIYQSDKKKEAKSPRQSDN